MNPTRTLAACLALALPLAAWSQTASSPTRAEVKQEGQAALKAGETPVGDKVTNKPDMSTKSSTTRAQVKSEAASGTAMPHGDVGARPTDAPKKGSSAPSSSKTRQQVKDEAKQANRQGDIPTGDLGKGSGADIANKPSNRKAAAAASAASQ